MFHQSFDAKNWLPGTDPYLNPVWFQEIRSSLSQNGSFSSLDWRFAPQTKNTVSAQTRHQNKRFSFISQLYSWLNQKSLAELRSAKWVHSGAGNRTTLAVHAISRTGDVQDQFPTFVTKIYFRKNRKTNKNQSLLQKEATFWSQRSLNALLCWS